MSAVEPLFTKAARLLGEQKQHIPGTFTLSASQVSWSPAAADAAKAVVVDISNISGSLQKSKKAPMIRLQTRSGHMVFHFDTLEDRDEAVKQLEPLVSQVQAKGKGPSAQANGNPGQLTGSPTLVALKKKLLQEDKEAQALYNDLVLGGLLTEQEFWRARQQDLLRLQQSDGGVRKQRAGIGNAMLVSVKPSADGKSNTIKFEVTPQGVQQVFMEKPFVHRAFMDNVPHKTNEKDFWQRYVKAEVTLLNNRLKAERGDEAAKLEMELGDEFFRPYINAKEQQSDFQQEWHAKRRTVDPTLNVAADDADRFGEGFGFGRNAQADAGFMSTTSSHDVIRGINRHAATILDSLPEPASEDAGAIAEAVRKAREARRQVKKHADPSNLDAVPASADWQQRAGSQLDDLRKDAQQQFEPLHIQDPRRYFDNMTAATAAASSAATAGQQRQSVGASADAADADAGPISLLEIIDSIDPTSLQHSMPPGVAEQVMADLYAEQSQTTVDAEGVVVGINPASHLPKSTQEECKRIALTCNELLRHFWSCFPFRNVNDESKAVRLDRALEKQYDRIIAMQTSSQGTERFCIKQLLKPVETALHAASERLQAERRAKGLAQHQQLLQQAH